MQNSKQSTHYSLWPQRGECEQNPFWAYQFLVIIVVFSALVGIGTVQADEVAASLQDKSGALVDGPSGFVSDNPIRFRIQGQIVARRLDDGTYAGVVTNGMYIYRQVPQVEIDKLNLDDFLGRDDLLELRAQRGVVFYSLDANDAVVTETSTLARHISGVYLEGDVVFQAGYNEITAERLYYDIAANRALILDGVMRMCLPDINLPLYLRADRIRQLSSDHFTAENIKLSNDEFYTPGTWLGAGSAEIKASRSSGGSKRLNYTLDNVTVNIGDVPVFWWPKAAGSTASSESPLREVHTSYSSDYGISIETKWDIAWLFGTKKLDNVDASLRIDEFTKRGPAVGIEADYLDRKGGNYFGNLKTYMVNDDGVDDLGRLDSRNDVTPIRPLRGRARWQHRQYLPLDWLANIEISYQSDPDFLESWEEREFDTDKEQETALYFKQQRNNWAFDFLGKWHLNDFDYTLTELPTAGFHVAGQDIFSLFTYHHDGYISHLRELAGDRDVPGFGQKYEPSILPGQLNNDSYAFAVSRHELSLPIHFDQWHLMPTVIGTYVQDDAAGDKSFVHGAGGFRAATQFWHVDNTVKSRIWNLHRLRHIIIPECSLFFFDSDQGDDESESLFGANTPGSTVSDRDAPDRVFNIGLRQRFQTMRGPKGNRHSVDFFRINTQVTLVNNDVDGVHVPNRFFFSSPEPQFDRAPIINADFANLGLARREQINQTLNDHASADWAWLISDTTAVTGMFNYNMHDGTISQAETGIAVQRSPRTSYYLSDRLTRDCDPFEHADSHILTAAASYRINRKYIVGIAHQYDISRTEASYLQAVLVRKFRHWYGAFSFSYDDTRDRISFQVSFWPESFSKIALGSRRFNRLAK